MDHLSLEYDTKSKMEFSVYLAPKFCTVIVELYNRILKTHTTLDHSNCTFIFDNETIMFYCSFKINRPSYQNRNRLIGQVLCFTFIFQYLTEIKAK